MPGIGVGIATGLGGSVPGPFPVRGGLIAYYQFGESAGQLLRDSSPNQLHGTWGSSTSDIDDSDPIPAVNPSVYYFQTSGTGDDTVKLPAELIPLTPPQFTMQMVFKCDATIAAEVNPMSWGGHSGAPYNYMIIRIDTSGNLRYWLGFTDNTFSNTAVQVITLGQWYVISLTYNGTHARMRVNGTEKINKLHGKALKTSPLSAGAISTGRFVGAIGSILLYDRVLTDAELVENESLADLTAPSGVNVNAVTATRAVSPLVTPTYDGSGQAIHPDVLYIPGGWNGWEYWMAMTPYPNSNDKLENPSILVSSDGTNWQVPAGMVNPIDLPLGGGADHLADTEIIIDPNNRMWCFWTDAPRGTRYSWSDDGVTWAAPAGWMRSGGGAGNVSPTIVYRDGIYHLWIVQHTDFSLWYYTSTSLDGVWKTKAQCRVVDPRNSDIDMWHLNVFYDEEYGEYHGLMTVIQNGAYRLWFATSIDGVNWTFARDALLHPAATGTSWDDSRIYRSAGVRTATGYDLWYSAQSSTGTWNTGRSTIVFP